jgi:WD40 repeat protein
MGPAITCLSLFDTTDHLRAIYCVNQLAGQLVSRGVEIGTGGLASTFMAHAHACLFHDSTFWDPVDWVCRQIPACDQPLAKRILADMRRDGIDPGAPGVICLHLATSDGALTPMAHHIPLQTFVSGPGPHQLAVIVTTPARLRQTYCGPAGSTDPDDDDESLVWIGAKTFVTTGSGRDLCIWNADGKLARRITNVVPAAEDDTSPADIVRAAWSPKRKMLALVCDDQLAFWGPTATGDWKCHRRIDHANGGAGRISWVLWGPGDDHAIIGLSWSSVCIWGIDGQLLRRTSLQPQGWNTTLPPNWSAALAPDGTKLLAVCDMARIFTLGPDHTLTPDHAEPTCNLAGYLYPSWSPDGSLSLVFGAKGRGVMSVCVDDKNTMTTTVHAGKSGESGKVCCHLAWHPDSSMFAVAMSCGDIELRRKNGSLVSTLTADASGTQYVDDIAWSPDGSTIAAIVVTTDDERHIKLFKVY